MRRLTAPLAMILLGGAAAPALAGGSQFPSALPPVANPGECYAQVKIPAQYSTGTQTVVTAEAHAVLDVTQPEFQPRDESVMTKEPSVRYVVRQPRYKTMRQQILVRPEHDRLSVAPPQFSTVTERLQTSAPHLVWKRGNPAELQRQGYIIHSTADGRLRTSGDYRGGSHATTQMGGDSCGPGCEIWCLVEEPGTSVTTTRRVMSAPSRVIRTPVPAQYQTITKQVVADPGGVEEVPVPAEYTTVRVQDFVRPAEAYETEVPAQYGTVQTKDLVAAERYEWRRVLCEPGTGTIRGGSSYSSHDSSGSVYSGGSGHSVSGYSSGGYSSGSYSSGGYTSGGHSTGSHSSGTTTTSGSGYYGTENYPAYQSRHSTRTRR